MDIRCRKNERELFSAQRWPYMLFWMFVLGSVAGFVLEGLWSLVHWGKWAHHAGVVWGPFCTIYGFGSVVILLSARLMPEREQPKWKAVLLRFLVCALAGSFVEYMVGFIQQVGFGSVSWDYSNQKYNIGGHVSLRMTVVWGAVGILFMQCAYPMMRSLIGRIQGHGGFIVTWLLIAFMCVNLTVSAVAVRRWKERGENIPPKTAIEAAIDETFHDDRMHDLFPNMQFCQPGSYSYEGHAA